MITHKNVVTKLDEILDLLNGVEERLSVMIPGTIGNDFVLDQLKADIDYALPEFPAIIKFCAAHRPDPDLIGNRLKNTMESATRIIKLWSEFAKESD